MIGAATVISAREWEPALAQAVTESAAARLVARAYRDVDVARRLDDVDVVVVGAETAWLSPARLRLWRMCGPAIIGVHAAGDRPARRLLAAGAANEIVVDSTPTLELLDLIRCTRPATTKTRPTVIEVEGHCRRDDLVEVALGLSFSLGGDVVMIEAHDEAPVLPLRVGVSPSPHALHMALSARLTGEVAIDSLARRDRLTLCPGAGFVIPRRLLRDLIAAFALSADVVVVVGGGAGSALPEAQTLGLLVVDGSPRSLLETAVAVGVIPPSVPIIALADHRPDTVRSSVLRWLGRSPDAVLPRPLAPAGGEFPAQEMESALRSVARRWPLVSCRPA